MEIADGRNRALSYVDSYRPGGFRVSGRWHEGALLVLPDRVLAWSAASLAAATVESLAEALTIRPEVLVLGCGARAAPADPALRAALKARGVVLEYMATAAACRTFNLLMSESRHAAAALLPLPAVAG